MTGRRIVDDEGRVRCRECGQFKPPGDMKWDSRVQRCQTICKRCKRQRDERNQPEKARERKKRRDAGRKRKNLPITRAEWRALRTLIARHQDEYDELVELECERVKDEVPIGVTVIPEHVRTIYGKPMTRSAYVDGAQLFATVAAMSNTPVDPEPVDPEPVDPDDDTPPIG